MSDLLFDCIVVGAGPAGLSASLFLARYLRKVVTFHHNSPRNLYSHGVHGFLGHHGILPSELLMRGRHEVLQHGGTIVEACVTRAVKVAEGHFRVFARSEAGVEQSFDARSLLLATGLKDVTPDCGGFRDFYGRSVYHCPDCDGFERAGNRIAVLGAGKGIVGFTLSLLTWTDQLTILTNGNDDGVPDEDRAQLACLGITTLNGRISRLEGDTTSGALHGVRFVDDEFLECDALFFSLGTAPASSLHLQLNCVLDEETGLVRVDKQQQTSVPGVYAAGDLTPHSQLAIVAAAEGAMAAIHIHKFLVAPGMLSPSASLRRNPSDRTDTVLFGAKIA